MATDAQGKHIAEPGDPDFDWAHYNVYKHQAVDPVSEAKQTLADTHSTAESLKQTGALPPPASEAQPIGGLTGSEHPVSTWLKGFAQGGAEGLPTAARIAQVALPFATGGASIPAQMAVGAGTQALADLADRAAGDPNAPQTFTDYLTHAATGAILPGVIGGAGKAISALAPLASKGTTGGLIGAGLGGYEGYKRGGVMGGVEGAALGTAGGSVLANKLGKLSQAVRGLKNEVPAAEGLERYMPNTSGYRGAPQSTEVPGSTYKPFTPGAYRNVSQFTGPTSPVAEAENVAANASYGEGHVIPGQLPSEYPQPPSDPIQYSAQGQPAIHVPQPWEQMPAGYEVTGSEAGHADIPMTTINGRQFPMPPPSMPVNRLQQRIQALQHPSATFWGKYGIPAKGVTMIENRLPDSLRKSIVDMDTAYAQTAGRYPGSR